MFRFSAVLCLMATVLVACGWGSKPKGQVEFRPRLPEPTPVTEPTPDPTPAPEGVQPTAAPQVQPPAAPLTPPVPLPKPAPPPFTVGSAQQSLINGDRAAAGLAPLNWNSCLSAVAGQESARMAKQDQMSHAGGATRDLACGLSSRAGENVGWCTCPTVNDPLLNQWFMASPEHRANILGGFRYVGTSWAGAASGRSYLAVEFS